MAEQISLTIKELMPVIALQAAAKIILDEIVHNKKMKKPFKKKR